MRSPLAFFRGRVLGVPLRQITRRTVPCYKYVDEEDGDRLSVCLLIDSKYLFRYPFENAKLSDSLALKARYLRGEMEHLRLREYQPGHCRYVDGGARSAAGA
jgi:hypothetical protein